MEEFPGIVGWWASQQFVNITTICDPFQYKDTLYAEINQHTDSMRVHVCQCIFRPEWTKNCCDIRNKLLLSTVVVMSTTPVYLAVPGCGILGRKHMYPHMFLAYVQYS